jgi:hypothetical protein
MKTGFKIGSLVMAMLLPMTAGHALGQGAATSGEGLAASGDLVDREALRARREVRVADVQNELGLSDEQFAAIASKVEAVMNDVDDVEEAMSELTAALDDSGSAPEAIAAKGDALRGAIGKANENLPKDRAALKFVLNGQQQAKMPWDILGPNASTSAGGANSGGPSIPASAPASAPGSADRPERAAQMAQIKSMLNMPEDQFSGVEPKLTAVLNDLETLQLGLTGGDYVYWAVASGGVGRRPANAAEQAVDGLIATLSQNNPAPEIVELKVAACRGLHAKASEKLAREQAELKTGLTTRQEAVLVVLGVLS